MPETLLMVIPPTVRIVDGKYEVENDYANNLCAYLDNFEHVTFACPVAQDGAQGILRSRPISDICGANRLTYIRLPYTYREDKHLLNYLSTRRVLISEITKAKYLLFSPHAKYDWPTLGVRLAMELRRKYCIESDWDHQSVWDLQLRAMPLGVRKLRKSLWARSFVTQVTRCMAHSSVALLQGQEVYDAYKTIAPNPQKALNVQVSADDQISAAALRQKLEEISRGTPLSIVYAGRMIEMKGPLDWLNAIAAASESGVALKADWCGDGPLMGEMRREIDRLSLVQQVSLCGVLSREELMTRLRRAHIFLFCHKTGESPRCLSEALATGCALVGYTGAFPRDLVAGHGGGEFVERHNWRMLASMISALDRNRPRLAQLVEAAASSGKQLDRTAAITHRIELIRRYLA